MGCLASPLPSFILIEADILPRKCYMLGLSPTRKKALSPTSFEPLPSLPLLRLSSFPSLSSSSKNESFYPISVFPSQSSMLPSSISSPSPFFSNLLLSLSLSSAFPFEILLIFYLFPLFLSPLFSSFSFSLFPSILLIPSILLFPFS